MKVYYYDMSAADISPELNRQRWELFNLEKLFAGASPNSKFGEFVLDLTMERYPARLVLGAEFYKDVLALVRDRGAPVRGALAAAGHKLRDTVDSMNVANKENLYSLPDEFEEKMLGALYLGVCTRPS